MPRGTDTHAERLGEQASATILQFITTDRRPGTERYPPSFILIS